MKESGEQMSDSVQMPALGESVTEGTVTRWLKQVGDHVEVDEPLLEVSTDKVDTEIPSPVSGVLEQILVGEDETVEVGADLARIGSGEGGDSQGSSDASAGQDEQAGGQQSSAEPQSPEQDLGGEQPSTEADSEQQAPEPAPVADEDGGSSQGSGSGSGTTVQMPALGESVTEGTVTRWLKQVGDQVEADEPLLEVSTDKVDTEIPSPVAGTVQQILVGEDETVAVGADLAVIGDGAAQSGSPTPADSRPAEQSDSRPAQAGTGAQAEPSSRPSAEPQDDTQDKGAQDKGAQDEAAAPASGGPSAEQPPTVERSSRTDGDEGTYVTPLVRRLAAQHGVDLASLTGTGVGGRIRKQDVLDAAEQAKQAKQAPAERAAAAPASGSASAPAASQGPSRTPAQVSAKRGTTEKMSRLRKVIAQRMVESLQVSAQLTSVVEVDVTRIAALRARAKADFEAREGTKLSFMPFFALAAVEALKQFPNVNASIEGDQIVYHAEENLGIAVDTEKGLIVPVIRAAGDLNIAGLARKIADLASRTRSNRITPDELGGGTFTLTNTGSRGALFDTPIINQPQVAILGTGAVVKRPMVVADGDGNEAISVRSMMYLAMSYDHRLVDGADAARFLSAMKARLEEGAFDADLGV